MIMHYQRFGVLKGPERSWKVLKGPERSWLASRPFVHLQKPMNLRRLRRYTKGQGHASKLLLDLEHLECTEAGLADLPWFHVFHIYYDLSSGMDRQVIDSKRLANGWLALWVGIVAGNSYHQTRFCLKGVVWAKESDHIQDCIVWHFFWSIWSMVLHLCNILFAHLWINLGLFWV